MKKTIFALGLVIALASCGNPTTVDAPKADSTKVTVDTAKVAKADTTKVAKADTVKAVK